MCLVNKSYKTIQNNTIQYNTIQYNTIQYNTIQYNTIQYNTIQYNTIQYNTIDRPQIFNVVVVYQEVEELFNRIDREQNGKLDVLVNNAYAGKLSNPEYIHLKVNETINYKKTVQFYSAIFLLQFFELRYFFPLIRNHS
jgi:hypothetical protein